MKPSEHLKAIKHPEISQILVFPSQAEAAQQAAELIINLVKVKEDAVITYATGQTQIPVHQEIRRLINRHKVDFSRTYAFQLDEYYPCSPDKSYSFVGFLKKYVFLPFGIKKENIFMLDGSSVDPDQEAENYNRLLTEHPVDLVILGIGPGGHIAFNEPGSPFDTQTRVVKLSRDTLIRDRMDRNQDTPDQALTQGIANILAAKKILLVAYGREKGGILKKALWEKIDPLCPASALRLKGDRVTIIVDQAAAEEISKN